MIIGRRKFFSFMGTGVAMIASPSLFAGPRPIWTEVGEVSPYAFGGGSAPLAVTLCKSIQDDGTFGVIKQRVLAYYGVTQVPEFKEAFGQRLLVSERGEIRFAERTL